MARHLKEWLLTIPRSLFISPHPPVMLRRQARERREYLYRKSLEAQEAQLYAKKQRVRQLLAEGKPIPRDLRDGIESEQLARGIDMDASQSDPLVSFDSEYAMAGTSDPRILLTTSRSPSSRLTAFAKEMRLVFPNSTRINRGGYKVHDLAAAARANNITDLIVVHEHRGVPDAMVVSHFPHGPTALFTLHNVVLRHEVAAHSNSTVSEQYPHLIFDGFESKLGARIRDILKYLFPAPKEDSKRVMTFRNERDFLSFRHHVFLKTSHKEVSLAEVGPRFEMRPYEIRQGTLEMGDSADVEWVLRPFMRTSGKRDQL